MKKIWKQRGSFVLAICILLSMLTFGTAVFADELPPVTVTVDGEQIQFDVQPIMEEDRVLVPMRFIFEALGAEVTWDDALQKATAVKGADTIEISVDQTVMLKNGQEILLDVPARLVNDRTLVPVRAVSEGLDANVEWIEETQQVVITTTAEEPPAAATPAPTATKAPEETTAPENNGETYTLNELSSADMDQLKDSYNNLIRYTFEQAALPLMVLEDNEEIIKDIRAKNKDAVTFAEDVWNQVVIQRILEIQMDSEDTYTVDEGADISLDSYMAIVEDAGLEASDYFDVTFETLDDRSVMMLLTFKEIDTLLACKYIGVVVRPDDTVRYFTAETDIMDKENLYFCEVTTEARGTLGIMGFEKEDFIAAVESVL